MLEIWNMIDSIEHGLCKNRMMKVCCSVGNYCECKVTAIGQDVMSCL